MTDYSTEKEKLFFKAFFKVSPQKQNELIEELKQIAILPRKRWEEKK